MKKSEGETDNVEHLGDVLLDLLKSFDLRLLEECPWLPSDSEGTKRWGLLKKLLIGSTTVERNFFLKSLELCELSFAMLTTVRDDSRFVIVSSFTYPLRFSHPDSHDVYSFMIKEGSRVEHTQTGSARMT